MQIHQITLISVFSLNTILTPVFGKANAKYENYQQAERAIRLEQARFIESILKIKTNPKDALTRILKSNVTNADLKFLARNLNTPPQITTKVARLGSTIYFGGISERLHSIKLIESYPRFVLELDGEVLDTKLTRQGFNKLVNYIINRRVALNSPSIVPTMDRLFNLVVPPAEAGVIGTTLLGGAIWGLGKAYTAYEDRTAAVRDTGSYISSGISDISSATERMAQVQERLSSFQKELLNVQSEYLGEIASRKAGKTINQQVIKDTRDRFAAKFDKVMGPWLKELQQSRDSDPHLKFATCTERTRNKQPYTKISTEMGQGQILGLSRTQSGQFTELVEMSVPVKGASPFIAKFEQRQKNFENRFNPIDVEGINDNACLDQFVCEGGKTSIPRILLSNNLRLPNTEIYKKALSKIAENINVAKAEVSKLGPARLSQD